jgi:predicted CXXCH cytochrome family protein
MNKNVKIAIIVVLVLIAGLIFIGGGYAGKFLEINKNIATNLAKDPHAPYRVDDLSKEYIKNNTGVTDTIKEEDLPQAFRPYKEVIHPPFRQGACHVCHAPKKDKVAEIVTKTVEELCYMCHPPVTRVKEELNCNKCHSPHHADKKKLVRNKVIEEECPAGDFEDPTGTEIKREIRH